MSRRSTMGWYGTELPATPANWTTPYAYAGNTASGTFVISATGDGTTVSLP